MKPKIYIETSIVSYLTAQPSRDIVTAARQQITREWRGPLPQKAAVDALHIAAAVSSGLDYLLTWNFKHLANAAMRARIDGVCRDLEYEPCIICTPEELLED